MSDLEAIFRTIDELSSEEKLQIVEYIQTQPEIEKMPRLRVFDLHEGAIWMSDDFDDELPDSFWLGEE